MTDQIENKRPTVEITAPHGKNVVVIKEYLTGAEKRDINNVFLSKVDIKAGAQASASTLEGLKGSALVDFENAQIKNIVVSVDGNTEDVLKALLDMRSADTDFVIKHVQDVFNDIAFAEKKTA